MNRKKETEWIDRYQDRERFTFILKRRHTRSFVLPVIQETREKMVVYQALYGDFGCYVRPLEMFLSEVDHEKYPEVTQKYRFELADEVKENAPEDTMAKSLEVNPHQVDIVDLSNDEPAVSDAEGMKETEEQADPALLVFLDADTLEEKYEILKSMRGSMTDPSGR